MRTAAGTRTRGGPIRRACRCCRQPTCGSSAAGTSVPRQARWSIGWSNDVSPGAGVCSAGSTREPTRLYRWARGTRGEHPHGRMVLPPAPVGGRGLGGPASRTRPRSAAGSRAGLTGRRRASRPPRSPTSFSRRVSSPMMACSSAVTLLVVRSRRPIRPCRPLIVGPLSRLKPAPLSPCPATGAVARPTGCSRSIRLTGSAGSTSSRVPGAYP